MSTKHKAAIIKYIEIRVLKAINFKKFNSHQGADLDLSKTKLYLNHEYSHSPSALITIYPVTPLVDCSLLRSSSTLCVVSWWERMIRVRHKPNFCLGSLTRVPEFRLGIWYSLWVNWWGCLNSVSVIEILSRFYRVYRPLCRTLRMSNINTKRAWHSWELVVLSGNLFLIQ